MKLFGLGLIKGTAIGLTGGILIGLVFKEACKQLKDKKYQRSNNSSLNENSHDDIKEV
tara:strand:+ start:195 stop:368 length:174 start_codon:yes stop_codon:yes gene_type:complete